MACVSAMTAAIEALPLDAERDAGVEKSERDRAEVGLDRGDGGRNLGAPRHIAGIGEDLLGCSRREAA